MSEARLSFKLCTNPECPHKEQKHAHLYAPDGKVADNNTPYPSKISAFLRMQPLLHGTADQEKKMELIRTLNEDIRQTKLPTQDDTDPENSIKMAEARLK